MTDQQTRSEIEAEGFVAGFASAKKILDTLSRSSNAEISAVLAVMIEALKGDH